MTDKPTLDSFPEALRPIAEKVLSETPQGRIDAADATLLFETPHVLQLGRLAQWARHQRHGDTAFFNVNRHINPTNVCIYTYNCKFCSFAALKGEDHAWEMTHDEVYEHAAKQGGDAVTEFHIVGGLHPDLSHRLVPRDAARPQGAFPECVHLKAFTAIEIGWFAKLEKISIAEVLEAMRDAGLGSLPGGGAEIFHPEVREIICDGKLDADEWIEVHRIAHGMGIRSNCTMLYGHVEKPSTRSTTCMRLRDLQDETGGFNAFIPLAYHPENNYMGLKYHTTGLGRPAQHIAISRLVLDNIPHIKAYWIMISPSWPRWRSPSAPTTSTARSSRRRSTTWPAAEHRAAPGRAPSSSGSCARPASPGRARHALQPDRPVGPERASPRRAPDGFGRHSPFHYLAVDGPIGVGKTTLVEKLARRFEGVKILEDVNNPFLPDFYDDRPGSAFQTELYFLLSRYKQQQDIAQRDLFDRLMVADYTFPKNRIFAYLNLSDDELMLFDKLFTLLEPADPGARSGALPGRRRRHLHVEDQTPRARVRARHLARLPL